MDSRADFWMDDGWMLSEDLEEWGRIFYTNFGHLHFWCPYHATSSVIDRAIHAILRHQHSNSNCVRMAKQRSQRTLGKVLTLVSSCVGTVATASPLHFLSSASSWGRLPKMVVFAHRCCQAQTWVLHAKLIWPPPHASTCHRQHTGWLTNCSYTQQWFGFTWKPYHSPF